jgi:hypothetical protein
MRVIIRWSPPTWRHRLSRTPTWHDRLRCALLGHDDEIAVGERVMALRCRRCDWRSAGWDLDLRVNAPGENRRAVPLVPLPLRTRTTTS